MGSVVPSLKVKRPEREAKNEWSYTSITPTCLHGMDRNNLSCTFTVATGEYYCQGRGGATLVVRSVKLYRRFGRIF